MRLRVGLLVATVLVIAGTTLASVLVPTKEATVGPPRAVPICCRPRADVSKVLPP
jgi:hypothetical protein